jgi:hypothetical protein
MDIQNLVLYAFVGNYKNLLLAEKGGRDDKVKWL